MRYITWSVVLALFSACTHQIVRPERYLLRFQNTLGLEVSSAGCSIINYGGLDRLCDYVEQNPSDVLFQVGPAFSRVIREDSISAETRTLHRRLVWSEWIRQKVAFYGVSALDLEPSLEEFRSITQEGGIKLISTNIIFGEKHLFEPYYLMTLAGKPLVFLAFSEPRETKGVKAYRVEDPAQSLRAILDKIPSTTQPIHILGYLSQSTREKIGAASDRPLLFIGGSISESNTVDVLRQSGHHWIKAPDVGRGLGEIILTPASGGGWSGSFNYEYTAIVLYKKQMASPRCLGLSERILQVTQARACAPSSKFAACRDK